MDLTTPTLSLSITLILHMMQKGYQTKYYRRKHTGNKDAFLHGKFEMWKECLGTIHYMLSL